jgi:hypothetical protein
MAPSILGSNGKARRKTTPQTRRIGRNTVQQPQRPVFKKKSTSKLRKDSPKTNSGIPNVDDHEDYGDLQLHIGPVLDPTLPKDDKEREVWARKLYYALLNGPNFYQEAGAKAWEVLVRTRSRDIQLSSWACSKGPLLEACFWPTRLTLQKLPTD